MNGVNIGSFDLNSPPDTQSAGLGDDAIRSVKSTLQQVVNDEHIFASAGGVVGAHRLGSARVYVGTQSQVSSAGTDGRLMFASDTSRLFHVGSAGTAMVGAGPFGISMGSTTGMSFPQRHYWAAEYGTGITGSAGSARVEIPNSGYSGVPMILLTSRIPSLISAAAIVGHFAEENGTHFVVQALNQLTGSTLSGFYFGWMSFGTRVL